MSDKYIIYCRRSTESEDRQVLSIESQLKELQEFAKRAQFPVARVITESKSAKQPGRPGFKILMKHVSRGEVRGIIAWKLDRLARNPVDGTELVWALDQGELFEVVTPQNTLRNSSNDKFLMQLEFGMAKKYVDDLSDNVKRGNRAKLEKGWLPGRAPVGYVNDPADRTIKRDPQRFDLVRRLWDLLLQGMKPPEICRIAAEDVCLTTRQSKRRGGTPLALSSVYRVFNNPFYYGMIHRKGADYVGKHEPMVTEDEYWKGQELLGVKGRARSIKHRFALTGIFRCGECGCSITAESRVNPYGSRYVYYRCTKKKRDTPCHARHIRLEEMEQQIIKELEGIDLPEKILQLTLDRLKKEKIYRDEKEKTFQIPVEKARQVCERKLENLNQMKMKDLIEDEEYLREKQVLVAEKLRLQSKMKMGDGREELVRKSAAVAFTLATGAVERFIDGSPEVQKLLVQELGSNFLVRDKKVIINLLEPFIRMGSFMKTMKSEKYGLEFQNILTGKSEIDPSSPIFPIWCTLIDDVRTFYRDRLTIDSFDHF